MFNMFDDVHIQNTERKFIRFDDKQFICDLVHMGTHYLCRGENIKTKEFTDWIKIEELNNPQYAFGAYLKENY